jgi:NADH-quinone oxidoreductase subunit M
VSRKLEDRPKEFFFLCSSSWEAFFGVFISRDLFLLFFFIELAVIPKFILINTWGSKYKEYASMKYTLYLLAGSAVALIGIIAIFMYAADPVKGLGYYTFDIEALASVKYDPAFQKGAFIMLLIGFGVLVPIFPLHRWTPDGHSAAPTAISMLLAASS